MTVSTTSPLLTAPLGPTIVRLAAPNMISQLVTMLTLMAEIWFVGQLGTVALAGLALAFPMMMLVMMMSAGAIGGAITGAVARRLGAGNRAGAEELAIHAVLLEVLLALIFASVFLSGGRWIYGSLGGSGEVLEQALAYSNVLFLGGVSMWLASALAAIVRATGNMSVAAKSQVAGSALQVMAAGSLTLGLGPLPKLGIAGAAAGIVIGHAFAALAMLIFLTTRCKQMDLRVTGFTLQMAPIMAILRVGAPASINTFCTLAATLIITGYMARLGVDVLAGYGIGSRLEFLLVPIIFGFGAASTVIVGAHFGANAIARGHRAGWTATLYSALLCGFIGGVVALFPGLWANMFTDSEAVRAACGAYLQIVGPFYAFFGVGLCLYFASQGAGRMTWPVIASLVRVFVVVIGCGLLARSANLRQEPFFWMIATGMVVQALISGTAIRLGAWTRGREP